ASLNPGHSIVMILPRFRTRAVPLFYSPIGARPRGPTNQLSHRSFSSAFVRIGAVGDVAVEIFRDCDFGRERAPTLRHFDVLLLEDNLAAVVIDFRCDAFPCDLIGCISGRGAVYAIGTRARSLFR